MDQLSDNIYAVILAGGSGTRFWPKSRHKSPKQLCKIGNDKQSMLEITLARLDDFIPPERRLIVTHCDQIEDTKKIAGDHCSWYLSEPEARNTANALTLAALEVNARHKDNTPAIMVSLHADHVIKDIEAFRKSISDGVKVAQDDKLTLLGIVPEYAETGYGYIEKGEQLKKLPGHLVKSFREKPDRNTAEAYIKSNNFLWNAGIFIWKTDVLLNEIKDKLPPAFTKLKGLLEEQQLDSFASVPFSKLAETYGELAKISIDNAILETSKEVAVVDADIGWQDVGSWDAIAKCFETDTDGNLLYGDVISIDNQNLTVDTDGPMIACIGLKDLVVVSAKGAVLVCPPDRAQDVRKVVEKLKEANRHEYL